MTYSRIRAFMENPPRFRKSNEIDRELVDGADFDPIESPRGRACVIRRELFEQISDYTRSQPTGPSPGRIYRKALNWPALSRQYPDRFGEDPNWFIYVCVRAFDGSGVDHVPFHVAEIIE